MIKATQKEIARALGLPFEQSTAEFEWGEHIRPYQMAPTILEANSKVSLKPMQFSLLPSWSKEPRLKFATHNARIESIESKPTWKRPFVSQHCLVPITHFIEPIYEGAFAGSMLQFFSVSQTILFAAGLYDRWQDSSGRVVFSFAIITKEACAFISQNGHDRQPIFVDPLKFSRWLKVEKQSPAELKDLLIEIQPELQLSAHPDRAMKPGWEKRRARQAS